MKNESAVLGAVQSLAAASEAVRLYGADHAVARKALDVAVRSLGEASRQRGFSLALGTDGLLVESTIVTEPWARNSVFFESITRGGTMVVRLDRAVDRSDMDWMLRAASETAMVKSPSGRVCLRRVEHESLGGCTP